MSFINLLNNKPECVSFFKNMKIKQDLPFFVLKTRNSYVTLSDESVINVTNDGRFSSCNVQFVETDRISLIPGDFLSGCCATMIPTGIYPKVCNLIYIGNLPFGDTLDLPSSFKWKWFYDHYIQKEEFRFT